MGRILKGVIKKLVHTYQVAKWEMAECQGHPEKKVREDNDRTMTQTKTASRSSEVLLASFGYFSIPMTIS